MGADALLCPALESDALGVGSLALTYCSSEDLLKPGPYRSCL